MSETTLQPWQRPPFEPGNRLAETHGVHVKKLQIAELEDMQQIADALRELCTIKSPALEPLIQIAAAKYWRWKKGKAWLKENTSELVTDDGRFIDLAEALDRLEGRIVGILGKLSMTPEAAAELGFTLAKTDALVDRVQEFDETKLTDDELATWRALQAKARLDP